ncbi:MAG: hypothetical protein JNJ69_09675 [Leptospiraceae bacterium]|nr:hypothetical protein [Leptospiraceae bacterium]
MNWPNIRNFPVSARVLIAIYTMLMGSILVVALALSSWHHGLVTEKAIEKKNTASSAATLDASAAVKAAQKPDDGQSSGVIVEPDSEATVKVKTLDWFIYENFKLGHTHLNGQSLVYFSLIILFLISTASEKMKILWGVLLAFSIVIHTFGLFFMHKDAFAMLLRFSGGLLALSITVMCAYVFVDTVKRPVTQ